MRKLLLPALLILAASACEESTQPAGTFSISTPATLSIRAGSWGIAYVTIARGGGLTDEVSLSLEGAPAGLSFSFDPAVVPGDVDGSDLKITVARSVAPGTYNIKVYGHVTDMAEQEAQIVLTVTEPSGFDLQVSAATVRQGQIGTATITVTRQDGFTGGVTLVLEGAPAGVTATLGSALISAGQSTGSITYSVLATAAAGYQPLTLRGSGGGVPDVAVPVDFTVGMASPGNVTFTQCDLADAPIWFAYQDGTSQWTQVALINGRYSFQVSADKGGITLVNPWDGAGSGYGITTFLATRAELIELGNRWCSMVPATKALSGEVATFGPSPNDWFTVGLGTAWVESHNAGPHYEIENVPTGPRDLVAVKTNIYGGIPQPATMIIRRQTDYPAGSIVPVLDFGSAEAFQTTFQQVQVTNLTGNWEFDQAYVTAGGTLGLSPHFHPPNSTPSFFVVPAAKALEGDFYSLRVQSREVQGGPTTRSVSTTFVTPGPQTLTLGPDLLVPSVFTLQAVPWYRMRVVTTLQTEYSNQWSGSYEQETRDGGFYVTTGYAGGSAVDITTPDLRTVPGWNPEWGPVAGSPTTLTGTGFGWSGVPMLFPSYQSAQAATAHGGSRGLLSEPNVVLRTAAYRTAVTP